MPSVPDGVDDGTSSASGLLLTWPMLGYCFRPTLLGLAFLADAEEVTLGVTELADAGILFLVDPAGTVTADAALLRCFLR